MENSKMADALISDEAQGKKPKMLISIKETDDKGSVLEGNYNGQFVIQAIAHLIRFVLRLSDKQGKANDAFQTIVNILGSEFADLKPSEVNNGSK